VDPPEIHPLKVITAITNGSSCSEYCYLAGRTVNDRNPEFSGGALLHQSSYVNLAVAVEVSTRIKGIHAIGEFVFLRE